MRRRAVSPGRPKRGLPGLTLSAELGVGLAVTVMIRGLLRAALCGDPLDLLVDERRNALHPDFAAVVGRLHLHEEGVDVLVVARSRGENAERGDLAQCQLDDVGVAGRLELGQHRDLDTIGRTDMLRDVDVNSHCSFSSYVNATAWRLRSGVNPFQRFIIANKA